MAQSDALWCKNTEVGSEKSSFATVHIFRLLNKILNFAPQGSQGTLGSQGGPGIPRGSPGIPRGPLDPWALGPMGPRAHGSKGPLGIPGLPLGIPGPPWDPRVPWDPWGAKFKILFKSRNICTVAKLDFSDPTSVFLHHRASDWAI